MPAPGHRSLPVLVAPDGRSAAGVGATDLAGHLLAGPASDMPRHTHDLADAPGAVSAGAAEATGPAPSLHPDLTPLAGLLGEWQGAGHGSYPSIEDFDYTETLTFTHTGKAFLVYAQRTRSTLDGRPLHVETGYLRPAGPGGVELVVAQPTGIVEVDEGALHATAGGGIELRLASRSVGLTSSAKTVTGVERTLILDAGVLHTRLAMAAVGHPLTHHLASELHRRSPSRGPAEIRSPGSDAPVGELDPGSARPPETAAR